ncbi:MAG: hypothetical protein Q3962_07555 [Corynebacterium sp.]|nr:hypothetical protein [Corynebacterium sp.]
MNMKKTTRAILSALAVASFLSLSTAAVSNEAWAAGSSGSSFGGSSFLGSSSNNTTPASTKAWSDNSRYFALDPTRAGTNYPASIFRPAGVRPGMPLFSGDRVAKYVNADPTPTNVGSLGFIVKDVKTGKVYAITSGSFAKEVGVDVYTMGTSGDSKIGSVAYVANNQQANVQSTKPNYALIELEKNFTTLVYPTIKVGATNPQFVSTSANFFGDSSGFFVPADFAGSTNNTPEAQGLVTAGEGTNKTNWLAIGNPSDYRSDRSENGTTTLRRICMVGIGAGEQCAVSIQAQDTMAWLGTDNYIYGYFTQLENPSTLTGSPITYSDGEDSSLNYSLGGPAYAFTSEGFVPLGIIDTFSSKNRLMRAVSLNAIFQDAAQAGYTLQMVNSLSDYRTAINASPNS